MNTKVVEKNKAHIKILKFSIYFLKFLVILFLFPYIMFLLSGFDIKNIQFYHYNKIYYNTIYFGYSIYVYLYMFLYTAINFLLLKKFIDAPVIIYTIILYILFLPQFFIFIWIST